MAAGIMQQIYTQESLPGLIESAGTADWNVGQPATPLSVAVARRHGIEIGAHRARQVCPEDFSRFDRIYAMDRDNEITLKRIAPAAVRQKIKLLRGNADVEDPYQGRESVYERTFTIINDACRRIADQLKDSGAT
jgi:protein-tyrosine phosphatase